MADFRIGDYDYTIIDANNNYVQVETYDKTKSSYGALSSTIEYEGEEFTVTSMSRCFYNCTSFDQSITIPESVTDMSNCFAWCDSFNHSVVIPESVTNMSGCFGRCTSFNQLIIIPESVTNMSICFAYCYSFNEYIVCFNKPSVWTDIFQGTTKDIKIIAIGDDNYSTWRTIRSVSTNNVRIPDNFEFEYGDYKYTGVDTSSQNYIQVQVIDKTKTEYGVILSTYINNRKVTNMASCFQSCTSFNQSITILNSVTNMSYCFNGCTSLNQPITIPNSVTNMNSCFMNCTSFNQSIIIPNSVTDMGYCFRNCASFNQSIIIPNLVADMTYCFRDCTSFNQSITISNSVINMSYCFTGCTSFNQSITMPNSVINMQGCFSGCTSFNKSIDIPNSVTNMRSCFNHCDSFNKPIIIPKSVTTVRECFRYCYNFNSSVTFEGYDGIGESSLTNMQSCFLDCTSFNQSLTIPDSVTNMIGCFYGCTSLINNIVVHNSTVSSGQIFYGITNDIYIINGQHGQSNQDAVAQTWRAIAANYVKVHYEVDDHTRPTLTLVCTRTDSTGTPSSTGTYIKLEKSVVIYDDYIPYGWTKTSISKKVYQDSVDLAHDITPNPDEGSFVVECDDQRHIFFYKVSYQINGEEISIITNSIITKVTALLDFLGKGNEYGYIDEPGMGMSIGTIAKRDGVNIEFPTTIGKNLLPPVKEAYKITSDTEVDNNKTYYTYNINDDIYEVVSNPIDDNIRTYYEKGKAVDLEKSQLIIGEYNQEDNDKAFIIGNGTGDEAVNRSNALTIDQQGRIKAGNYSGVFQSIFDIFYPVGSYYETSLPGTIPSGSQTPTAADIANLGVTWFDPNYAWGGTWVKHTPTGVLNTSKTVSVGSGQGAYTNTLTLEPNTRYVLLCNTLGGQSATLTTLTQIEVRSGTPNMIYNPVARTTTSSGQGVSSWAYMRTGSGSVTVAARCYGYSSTTHSESIWLVAIPLDTSIDAYRWHRTA